MAWKIIKKHARTQFTANWTPTTIVEIGDCIHHDFQASLQTDLCKYMGWIWVAQHELNNKQGCRHKLSNKHKSAKLEDYYLPMAKEQRSNWPVAE